MNRASIRASQRGLLPFGKAFLMASLIAICLQLSGAMLATAFGYTDPPCTSCSRVDDCEGDTYPFCSEPCASVGDGSCFSCWCEKDRDAQMCGCKYTGPN